MTFFMSTSLFDGRRHDRRAALGVLFALLCSAAVQAQSVPEPVPYNSIDLQAEAQREVANDSLNAVLFVEANDADSARLAGTLNRAINDAHTAAKAYPAVALRSGGYQAYPVYDRSQRLTGWRGRAEVRLQSRDFPAASALIGKLQSSLQLGSLGFTVSPELRKETQDQLITEAIGVFKARADIARAALGGKSYKIRRLSLSTQASFPPPMPLAMQRAGIAEAVAPPSLEGGTSRVSVAASGTIEIE
jgi:predicted secreted protein